MKGSLLNGKGFFLSSSGLECCSFKLVLILEYLKGEGWVGICLLVMWTEWCLQKIEEMRKRRLRWIYSICSSFKDINSCASGYHPVMEVRSDGWEITTNFLCGQVTLYLCSPGLLATPCKASGKDCWWREAWSSIAMSMFYHSKEESLGTVWYWRVELYCP